MHRIAARIPRLVAVTAIPVILATAACSLPGGGSSPDSTAESSRKPSPTVKPAKYKQLPDACKAVPPAMVKDMVEKVKDVGGKQLKSDDTSLSSGCSWNALAGYQFRWLDVAYKRYESEAGIGTGEKRAGVYYEQQADLVLKTEGAKGMKARSPKIGDEAITLTYAVTDKKQDFAKVTVVARTANVVAVLNYNGTGYQGAKRPTAGDLLKDAEAAAEKVIAAVE